MRPQEGGGKAKREGERPSGGVHSARTMKCVYRGEKFNARGRRKILIGPATQTGM